MQVKFIQYWNVLSGKREEFNTFLSRNYIPGINEIGLVKIIRSFHAVVGGGPYFILEGTSRSLNNVNRLLKDEEFHKLKRLLLFLVTGYKTRVLAPTNRIENRINENSALCSFNHHFDVAYDRYDEYTGFVASEYIPALIKQGIEITGEWQVCIGDGPNLCIEGYGPNVKQLLKATESPEYKQSTTRLLTMVNHYAGKILIPSGHTTQEVYGNVS